VAVCNRPAQRDSIINVLAESFPPTGVEIVRIDAECTDVLDCVLRQVQPGRQGPVMLIDLEQAIPSAQEDHPLIRMLNLRRPDWPVELPRPIVLWVPEYLLSILGRQAPDLLDWRSATFHFPDAPSEDLRPLQSTTWLDDRLAGTMNAVDRQRRVEELRARVAAYQGSSDPVAQAARAEWLIELARHARLFDLKEAERACTEALAIAQAFADRHGECRAWGCLGSVYAEAGKFRAAIECFEKALVIARETGDRRGELNALGSLGNAYQALGEPRRAIAFFEQALSMIRATGDIHGEAVASGNLGNIYRSLGNSGEAVKCYEAALALFRKTHDRRAQGQSQGNLGSLYATLGDLSRAIDYYRESLTIAREVGDRRGEAVVLGNMGNAYADLGECRLAIEHYEQQLRIAREIGDRRGEATALLNLAAELIKTGERDRALAMAQTALSTFEATDDPWLPQVRRQLEQWRNGS
jgi:tetratricopeptide (TPR) repeat protein